jgi:hypothetical protein
MSKNKTFTANEITSEISRLNMIFLAVQNAFPYVGLINFRPMSLIEAFTRNQIASFQTQNFLVRLFSVLQYFGVYDNFNKKDSPELYILKRLRNKFGHSLGFYNKDDEDDRNLMRKIIETFNLENKEYLDFPISNNIIIEQIINASIQYIKEHYP